MNKLLNAAMEYKPLGLSIVPIGNKKKSLVWWHKYQKRIMPDYLLMKVFVNPAMKGIAIICGYASGNFEAIDFDCKNDLTKRLFFKFIYRVAAINSKLIARLVIACTKNGGFHIYYRCRQIGRNTVLAKRPSTNLERANEPHQKVKVLIETRGAGGYIIVFPTDGYELLQNDFSKLPLIEPDERQMLLDVAKSFDQTARITNTKTLRKTYINLHPHSPFEDYNKRGDIIGLLQRHGWTIVRRTPAKTFFKRPGDTDHETSGDFNHELGLFGVFTSSTEFEPEKGYKPYAVYAILECDGDFKLAAKRLLGEGYGTPYTTARC